VRLLMAEVTHGADGVTWFTQAAGEVASQWWKDGARDGEA